ncbi:MAG: DUF4157 domain-containing protein [Dehalococcoidia bacterium]|nr:DUF4157 domain-containing protein [Dehalococcoidia bacterium]
MVNRSDRAMQAENDDLLIKQKAAKKEQTESGLVADGPIPSQAEARALTDPSYSSAANINRKAQAMLGLQRSRGNAEVQRLIAQDEQTLQEAKEEKAPAGNVASATGNDIVFGQGEYDPTSQGGSRLLARELTHVAQQNAPEAGQASPEVSSPDAAKGENFQSSQQVSAAEEETLQASKQISAREEEESN